MYTPLNKSKENSFPTTMQESRAIANSVGQRKNNVMQGLGFVDNRPEAIVQRKLQDEIVSNSSKIKHPSQLQAIAVHSQNVIQRLSHEYYDRAEIRYSDRAFAHLSQGEVEQYLWDNQSQIVVGQNQTILIGGGLRTGDAVNGNISYNCTYDENAGRHII